MASYMSKPADYGNYTQAINLDLVNFVMQSKQQKYDYNLAKLESKISDELGSIDLARTQDKEYFLNRANQALASAGDISKLDFSQSGVARQLDARINSVVDDRVLNDVISTSNYRAFQNTIQEKQKKDPELYSATNVAYAMEKQGVNSWLNGEDKSGKKVDSLGAISYEDYVDVALELKDISENLDKFANVVKENTPEGLYFKNVEGKYLTAEEIRNIAEQQLSGKAKRQMQINGWANYDGGNAEAQGRLVSTFQDYADGRIGEIDKVIAGKELQLKSIGDSNPALKERLTTEINDYKDSKRQTKEAYQSWISNNNLDSMSSTLENDRVLNSFANTFAFDNRGISYSTNQAALALQKLQMEASLKKQSGAGGIEGTTITDLFTNTPDRDLFQESASNVQKWDSQFKQAVNTEFNKLSEREREGIMVGYNENSGMTKEEYILDKLEELPGNKVINQVTLSRIEELKLKRDTYEDDYSKAVATGFEEAEGDNVPRVVEEYYDNPRVKMLDDNGKSISVADYLAKNGITEDQGALLNSPEKAEVKKRILQSYYADKILSKGVFEGFQERFDKIRLSIAENLGEAGIKSLGDTPKENATKIQELRDKKHNASEEDAMMMKRLVELTGSVEAADEFIKKSQEQKTFDQNQFQDTVIGTLTGGISNFFNRDDSVEDDSILNNWISLDEIKERGGKFLNAERMRPGKRQQAINLKVDSDMGEKIVGILSSGVNTISGEVAQFDINKNAGGMAIYETGPDSVRISGRRKDDGEWVPYEVDILKSALPPEFSQAVTFETDAPIFNKDTMKPVESKVSFSSMNDRRAFLDASYFLGSQELALGATKDGLMQNLFDFYPDVMGSKVQPSIYGNAIENMLESNNIFVKIEKEDDNQFYTKVVSKNLENNVETVLFSNLQPIPEDSYDEAYRMTKRVPQVYVSQIVNDAISQAQLNPDNPSDAMVNILKLYGK